MRHSTHVRVFLLAALLLVPSTLSAQFITSRTLSLDGARRVLAGAEAEARRNNWNVAISIVDPSGGQILFQRMDGVGPMPLEIAVGKAQTAARFRRPTRALQESLAAGNTAFLAIEGLMPLEGGIPIVVDGEIVGAIGVSGVTAQQDAQIAQAGIDALLR
jgi:glc operon protein GlcG